MLYIENLLNLLTLCKLVTFNGGLRREKKTKRHISNKNFVFLIQITSENIHDKV